MKSYPDTVQEIEKEFILLFSYANLEDKSDIPNNANVNELYGYRDICIDFLKEAFSRIRHQTISEVRYEI